MDLLLPSACAACGRMGAVVCDRCISSFVAPDDGAFVVADAGVAIGDALSLALGAFVYAHGMRRALGRLKYAGAARVGGPLASASVPALARLLAVSGPTAVLVPVPIHPARERQRGYNQAALLARELAVTAGVPVAEVLERHAATERQHQLDRSARLRNLRDVIRLQLGGAGRRRPRR